MFLEKPVFPTPPTPRHILGPEHLALSSVACIYHSTKMQEVQWH